VVTQTSLQAIWALVDLAEAPEGIFKGSKEIAQRIGARPNYLAKLLQTLAREGLLLSQKGVRGGFRLARDPAKIALLDVVDPIDHVRRWTGCILGMTECSDASPCLAHDRWVPQKNAYIALLSEITIADLVGHTSRVVLDRREPTDGRG